MLNMRSNFPAFKFHEIQRPEMGLQIFHDQNHVISICRIECGVWSLEIAIYSN